MDRMKATVYKVTHGQKYCVEMETGTIYTFRGLSIGEFGKHIGLTDEQAERVFRGETVSLEVDEGEILNQWLSS